MSNKKTHITLSFVKGLIKQLSDPYADESLKDSKQYCFDIPSGKQLFFRDLKLIGFAIRATRHSLVYTVEKKMPMVFPAVSLLEIMVFLHQKLLDRKQPNISLKCPRE